MTESEKDNVKTNYELLKKIRETKNEELDFSLEEPTSATFYKKWAFLGFTPNESDFIFEHYLTEKEISCNDIFNDENCSSWKALTNEDVTEQSHKIAKSLFTDEENNFDEDEWLFALKEEVAEKYARFIAHDDGLLVLDI